MVAHPERLNYSGLVAITVWIFRMMLFDDVQKAGQTIETQLNRRNDKSAFIDRFLWENQKAKTVVNRFGRLTASQAKQSLISGKSRRLKELSSILSPKDIYHNMTIWLYWVNIIIFVNNYWICVNEIKDRECRRNNKRESVVQWFEQNNCFD